MAVSYRQGCEAAAATALSDGMVLARTTTDAHTHIQRCNRNCMHVCEHEYSPSLSLPLSPPLLFSLTDTHSHLHARTIMYTVPDGITGAPIVLFLWMPCKSSAIITFKWLDMWLWCIMMIGSYRAVWAVALLFMPAGIDCNWMKGLAGTRGIRRIVMWPLEILAVHLFLISKYNWFLSPPVLFV